MRNFFNIEDSLANKISFWHLAVFLILLPYDGFYSTMVLISFAAHTIIHCRPEYLHNLRNPVVLLLAGFYLLGALTVAYSSDKQEGINIASRQLALLLMPILLSLNGLNFRKYADQFLLIFGLTCTVSVLYLFFDAVRTILYFHLPFRSLFTLAFMNHNFSLPIEMHATYLSMFVAFSIIIFTELGLRANTKSARLFHLSCSLILTLGLLQLSSRAVWIGFLIVAIIAFPLLKLRGRKRIGFMAAALLVSAMWLFAISRIDSFKDRYINELKMDLSGKVALVESIEPRLARWKLITGLIKQSPIIGYGMGSEKKMLKEVYFKNGLYNSYIQEFNTHSEYLGLMLKSGIAALMLFIFIITYGLRTGWLKKDFLLTGSLMLIAVVGVSENILDLNKGIFFFSFFYPLLMWPEKQIFARQNPVNCPKGATQNISPTI